MNEASKISNVYGTEGDRDPVNVILARQDGKRLGRLMRKWEADGFPWPLPDETVRDIAKCMDMPEDSCGRMLQRLHNEYGR